MNLLYFRYNLIEKIIFYYCHSLPLLRTFELDDIFTSELVFEDPSKILNGLPAPTINIAMETVLIITAEKLVSANLLNNDLLPEFNITPFHRLKIPRLLSFEAPTTKRDVFHLYVINIKLTPFNDDFEEAFYPCKLHKIQGYGILTTAKIPEHMPAFKIYPRYGEASVQVSYVGEIFIAPALIPLYTWFQNILFTCILSLKFEASKSLPVKKYFVLPVQKLRGENLPFKVANRFILNLYNNWDSEKENWQFQDFSIQLTDSIIDAVLVQTYRFDNPDVSYVEMERVQSIFVVAGVSDKLPCDELPDMKISLEDYYKNKYRLEVKKPDAPLLKGRHISKKYNMLFKRSDSYKPDFFLAEFCKVHPFPASLWNQATCLPSIIWRTECFTLTYELFTQISPSIPEAPLNPGSTLHFSDELDSRALRSDLRYTGYTNWLDLLQCITTKACQEEYDLERLEFLGDSVLKYVVSLFLFVTLPDAREGVLTQFKSKIVANKNLAVQSTKYLDLPRYILNDKFCPLTKWIPPGLAPATCEISADMTKDEVYNSIPERYLQSITEKDVADCCEAIIGLCFSKYGIRFAVNFLDSVDVLANGKQYLLSDYVFQMPPQSHHFDTIPELLGKLESAIGYKFKDPKYLLEATIYPSKHSCNCNYQRLEFLGDAILDLLIVCYIYPEHPNFGPGQLTHMKSYLVRNTTLAKICCENHFYDYLIHDSEDVRYDIEQVKDRASRGVDPIKDELIDARDSEAELENGSYKKYFGDLIEAFIGAIYIDCNGDCNRVWNVVMPWFKKYHSLCVENIMLKEETREDLKNCQEASGEHNTVEP